jgi:hypothetical protein
MKKLVASSDTRTRAKAAGKIPHERDESVDPVIAPPEPEMKQASADISSGMVDIDRGVATSAATKRRKRVRTNRGHALAICVASRPALTGADA